MSRRWSRPGLSVARCDYISATEPREAGRADPGRHVASVHESRTGGLGSELAALQLSRGGLGQRVYEFHGAGVLVWRQRGLHVILECFDEIGSCRDTGLDHDEGFDDLAALAIVPSNNSTLLNRWVLAQGGLDLGPRDVISTRHDHVVDPGDVPVIALRVATIEIACHVPAVFDEVALPAIGQIPATRRATNAQAAGSGSLDRSHLLIEQLDDVARHGFAGRTRTDEWTGRGHEDVDHLGPADAVDDAEPRFLEPEIGDALRQ